MIRWVLAFLLLTSAAHADITWVNYLQSNPALHRVAKYDLNGNKLDFGEDGDLKQFGSDCYFYGMSSKQGWIPNVNSPANGFHVYKFTNCDLNNPKDMGQLLDVTQTPVSTKCVGITPGVNFSGCWAPRMLFNGSNSKYVFFYEEYASGTQAIQVFECSGPAPASIGSFPCTYIGPLSGYTPGALDNIAVQADEQSNDAYLLGNNGPAGTVFIQKLTADYHGLTGSATNTGLSGENVWLAHPGTKWMVGAGTACAECSGATESYVSATTALGTYGGLTQLSPSSPAGCGTQGAMIAKIGSNYYRTGTYFQGGATVSQGQTTLEIDPLTITSGLFNAFTCNASVTITGVTSAGGYPTPPLQYSFDVNFISSLNSSFYDKCTIGNGLSAVGIMQQFVPTVGRLDAVAVNLGKGSQGNGNANGSLLVQITQDSAGVPGAVLASVPYAAGSIPWVSELTIVPVNLTLIPSTTYDLVIKTSGNTTGCFTFTIAEPSSPLYGSNLAKFTTDGTTWSTLTNSMFQISTIPSFATPLIRGFVAH